MFNRFTPEAKAVVVEAQGHARRLRHPWVGTEHLLLALLATEGRTARLLAEHGVDLAAAEVELARLVPGADADRSALADLGIDLVRVRDATESAFGPGALERARARRRCGARRLGRRGRLARRAAATGHIPFSRRAKAALQLALRESIRLRHRRIDAEHIALGVLREGRGVACTILARRGVPFDRLRAELEVSPTRAA